VQPIGCAYVALMCDDLGADELSGGEPEDEPEPTPAERRFYALGQLYRRWYHGALRLRPHDFDVSELARTVGVSRDIEMVTREPYGTAFHFDNEVLVVLPTECFPWVIWSVEHWAFYAELEEFAWKLEWD
jgi:hypothetical protein